jgi:hypothetical protein
MRACVRVRACACVRADVRVYVGANLILALVPPFSTMSWYGGGGVAWRGVAWRGVVCRWRCGVAVGCGMVWRGGGVVVWCGGGVV